MQKRQNKLYGGTLLWPGESGESRVIVCAPNRTTAAKLIGESQYVFNNFFAETGNKNEIEVANGREGVWIAPLNDAMKSAAIYKQVEPQYPINTPSPFKNRSGEKYKQSEFQQKEPMKKTAIKRLALETLTTINISAVAEDIINLKFKPDDTMQSCFDRFYAIMRKHGVKKGTPIRQGKKIIGTQVDNFAWTMCRNLFQDQVRSWIELELAFSLDIPFPKDLEY